MPADRRQPRRRFSAESSRCLLFAVRAMSHILTTFLSVYSHEFDVERRGRASVIKEEFVAKKIGHNANKTDYLVQRGRHAAPRRPLTPVPDPPAIAL
jgi:hypothetical protein